MNININKILSLIVCIISISAVANGPALAYKLSPININARLKGTLLFTPAEGGSAFSCATLLKLHTGDNSRFYAGRPFGACEITFSVFPWQVVVNSKTTATLYGGGWSGAGAQCPPGIVHLNVSNEGVWTFPMGNCISGSMTSDPPVTIVK